MFTMQIFARKYEVQFIYMVDGQEGAKPIYKGVDKQGHNVSFPVKMVTVCMISDFEPTQEPGRIGNDLIADGAAFCNMQDTPSFQEGRKRSFRRALKDAKLPKLERAVAWRQFFDLFGKY